jgi:putative ABC transport system permease protein
MLLRPVIGSKQYISIKLDDAAGHDSIASIESVFKKIFYGNAFNYYYLEDSINSLYSDDKRFSYIIRIFSVLTIIVSCFGLIGLSVYVVMKRTKEIGIRKILGSSGFSMIVLLSSSFIRLVVIGIVLSVPTTYFLMQQWLKGYAYHIELEWFRFVLPGAGIMVLAMVTISVQIIKTSMMSPVKSLKHE